MRDKFFPDLGLVQICGQIRPPSRHCEQGKRQPEGPTRAYLLVIERASKAVQKALHAA